MRSTTKPTNGGLLNPAFRYVPAKQTDIRKTFDRARASRATPYVEGRANQVFQLVGVAR